MKRSFLLLIVILSAALSFCKKKNEPPMPVKSVDSIVAPSYPTDTFSGISRTTFVNFNSRIDSTFPTVMTVGYMPDKKIFVNAAIISTDVYNIFGYAVRCNVIQLHETFSSDSSGGYSCFTDDKFSCKIYLENDSIIFYSGKIQPGCGIENGDTENSFIGRKIHFR